MEHRTTKFIKILISTIAFSFLVAGLNSCYYDNVEDLYPEQPACDTSNVSYSGTVAPVMAARCNSCHSATSASGGVITDNYNDLKLIVDNGRLHGAINHLPGFSPMPQGGEKLNDCTLAKIDAWINAGAPNN